MEGFVQKVSDEESEQYFRSRPREIQIGPAVSEQVYLLFFNSDPILLCNSSGQETELEFLIAYLQSTVIPGRQFLHQKYKELEEKYSDGSVFRSLG